MEPVIQVLQSPNSLLTHLDLSYNKLGETGVKLLCDSLKAPSTLQALGWGHCVFPELIQYTSMQTKHNFHIFKNSHVKCLSFYLSACLTYIFLLFWLLSFFVVFMVILRCSLGDCNLSGSCCEGLASLLIHPLLTLKELQLRGNDLGDSGVELLCRALKEPSCQLQRLG